MGSMVFPRRFAMFTGATVTVASMMLATLIACTPMHAQATEPAREDQQSFLMRALFSNGRLWLLSDAGELSTIAQDADKRVTLDFPEPVLDVCATGTGVQVITGTNTGDWTIRQWDGTRWNATSTVARQDDGLAAMNCGADDTTLLTSARVIQLAKSGSARITKLSAELPFGSVTAMHDTGTTLLVAINAGEWGGGLQRIDKASGVVTAIERKDGSDLCSGPLNAACDSVHGIATEPWNTRCNAVAVGLVHLVMERGGIVEVCGDEVRSLFEMPFSTSFAIKGGKRGQLPQTVAFFGLTASGGSLWAVGTDGLYRIDSIGKATKVPLPTFRTVDGIDVSFDNPQLVLVMTRLNQRHAVSGATPMLVPR